MKLKPNQLSSVVGGLLLFLIGCSQTILSPDHRIDYPGAEDVDPNASLGIVWEELPGNPALEQRVCPEWDCLGHTDPWVAKGPDDQRIVWFSTGGDRGGPIVGRALVDANLQFQLSPRDRPVLEVKEAGWNKHRETVSLYWNQDQNEWIMWYLGYETSFFEDPAFGQMRTNDAQGIDWPESAELIYKPEPGAWDFAFITGPTFIEAENGEWRLYYTGAGTTVGIGVLISHDQGKTWTPHPGNPVFERDLDSWDQGILEQSVLYVEGRYMMWYSGYEEPLDLKTTPIYIGLAVSDDGFTWERSPHNPVLGPSKPGTWNDLRVVSPHVIQQDDGSLLLFAHGQNHADIDRSLGRVGVWRSTRKRK